MRSKAHQITSHLHVSKMFIVSKSEFLITPSPTHILKSKWLVLIRKTDKKQKKDTRIDTTWKSSRNANVRPYIPEMTSPQGTPRRPAPQFNSSYEYLHDAADLMSPEDFPIRGTKIQVITIMLYHVACTVADGRETLDDIRCAQVYYTYFTCV